MSSLSGRYTRDTSLVSAFMSALNQADEGSGTALRTEVWYIHILDVGRSSLLRRRISLILRFLFFKRSAGRGIRRHWETQQ